MDAKTLYSGIPQSDGITINDKSNIQTHGTAMGKKLPPHMHTYLYGTINNICWIIAQTNLLYTYVT